jgi:hypothetical protein
LWVDADEPRKKPLRMTHTGGNISKQESEGRGGLSQSRCLNVRIASSKYRGAAYNFKKNWSRIAVLSVKVLALERLITGKRNASFGKISSADTILFAMVLRR